MGIGWDGDEHHAQRRDLKRKETGKRMERGEEEENVARGAGGRQRSRKKGRESEGEDRVMGEHIQRCKHTPPRFQGGQRA